MEKSSGSDRLFRYDNAKFVAIMMVVIGHCIEPYIEQSHIMKSFWIFIYSFHMPLFIFLMGLFSKRVINQPKYPGEKIYSYFLLYILYKITLYCTKILCGSKATFNLFSESGVPWFMLACVFFLFFTRLLRKCNKKIILVIAFSCGCLIGYCSISDFLCLSRTIVYFPFFLLGYYLNIDTLENFICNKKILAFSIICLAVHAMLCFFHTSSVYTLRPLFTGRNPFNKLTYPQWGAIYRSLYYIGIICLFPAILWIVSNRNLFFTKYGARTLQIYFLHRPLLYIYNSKFNVNQYFIEIFPNLWKVIYLLLGVILTFILACDLFEAPFKQIMNWNPKFPVKKYGTSFSIKQRLYYSFPIALFLSFTLGFFGPMDLWYSNAEELWFSRGSTFIIAIFLMLLIFSMCLLISLFINGNFLISYLTLLFGLSISFYIQASFLNIDFGTGVLDGGEINWGNYELYGLGNTLIWILLFTIPVVIKKYYKNFLKLFSFISVAIILMQSSALVFSVLNANDTYSGSFSMTTDGIYTLSKNENIIIFTLDTMDEQYFSEFLNENPEAKNEFQGFIHYDNTLTTGARTILAIPSILTGIPFKQQTSYSEHIENIWNGNTPLDVLSKNGYDVRVFTESTYYGSKAVDSINNLSTRNQKVGSYNILAKKMGKLSLYRYSPYLFKKFFWFNTTEFDLAKVDNIYSVADAKFYNNYLKNGGFTYTDNYKKAFRFYLLEGAHQPYTLTATAKRDKKGTTRKEQVKGDFYILFNMLSDLKKEGVFDRSLIIITADHGDKNYAQQSMLLCKLPYAQGELYTNHAPVSLFDLSSTLVGFIGEDSELYGSGINLFQIPENESRKRTFYLNTAVNSKPCIQEYITTEKADNIEAMILNHEYFVNNGKTQPYTLGESLMFTLDATANQYCTEGFRLSTGWRTPLAGPYSQMIIPLKDIPKTETLQAHFDVQKVDNPSNTIIKSGNTIIYEGKIDGSFVQKGLDLDIPVSSLVDNTINLEFEFTDIDINEMNTDTERRTMTISFRSFVIN